MQLQRGNAKGIDGSNIFIFFDVFGFSVAAAGRLIRAACSRNSIEACKGQVISMAGRSKVRQVGMPLILTCHRQAESGELGRSVFLLVKQHRI